MARRKDTRSRKEIAEDLLRPRSRFELWRRMRGYAQRHLDQRVAAGAPAKELRWIRADLKEIDDIFQFDGPIDTPPPRNVPKPPEQPMAPPGYEAECAEIMAAIVGEPT